MVGVRHIIVERHLIFSGHRERVFLGDEQRGQFLDIRIDIESLIGGHATAVVDHHVTHGVSTAAGCGEPIFGKLAQRRCGIEDVDIVDLDLLARGDMQMGGRDLMTDESHLLQLLRGDEPTCAADTQHVVMVLTLLVDTHRHAVRLQLSGCDLTGFIFLDKRLGIVDVTC